MSVPQGSASPRQQMGLQIKSPQHSESSEQSAVAPPHVSVGISVKNGVGDGVTGTSGGTQKPAGQIRLKFGQQSEASLHGLPWSPQVGGSVGESVGSSVMKEL